MKIYELENNIFVLETKNTHYVFGVNGGGYNYHLHWGEKCDVNDYCLSPWVGEDANYGNLDEMKQEYTVFGKTLYREFSLKVNFPDGCREINSKYIGAKSNGDTLCLSFADEYYPLEYDLNYRLYNDSDIITRSVTIRNTGDKSLEFERIFSAELTLPGVKPYKIRNTRGDWGSEFIDSEETLVNGALSFESRKGRSGHDHSPYFIAHRGADEKGGDVYFASLAYSGNFKVTLTRDIYGVTRALLGMNDFDFSFTLKGGESFEVPCVFFGRSVGFGEMSRMMNAFCIDHVLPKQFNKKILPVLYNSWEATEFDVNVTEQTKLAELAAGMGVELFVMDDGWFGARNNDRAGLGDWYVNKEKFPNGLNELIQNVNNLGMDFGIWVEPEMVNPDSDLFRAHPDWTYHYDTRKANEMRNQLVLNMTRDDVREYIFSVLDKLLTDHNIKYIKWDMNRPFSETGAENLENPKMLWYLHTKAVYDIVDALKAKHPHVQFESCSSGGGRCDLGALMHFDEVWPSDNTDGIDRMTLQKGYSMLHPIKTMRAWVTDIAGINKPCSLDFRFNIAMQGTLSVGSNLLKYSREELEICKKNIALYKQIRDIVQFGELYRLLDIEEDEVLMNQYVSPDKSRSVVFIAANGTRFYKKRTPILFDGLDESKRYSFDFRGTHYEKSGAYLMNVGFSTHIHGVDYNEIIIINEV